MVFRCNVLAFKFLIPSIDDAQSLRANAPETLTFDQRCQLFPFVDVMNFEAHRIRKLAPKPHQGFLPLVPA